jgi:5,6-dimethylbenzimidazole synthase
MTQEAESSELDFTASEKEAVYKAIFVRRDVRRFLSVPITDETVGRILLAAHHAPSVGFMQPWNFIVIRDSATKRQVKNSFLEARGQEAEQFSGERKNLYLSLKLEGIEEAPVNICVTCDPTRHGPAVLGRTSIPQTDVYSTCCAVQNLWLAARVEGIGVGWVSILSQGRLREILEIPAYVIPVAYLCMGYPERFESDPELEKAGWLRRLPADETISYETWRGKAER